jgi:hypothetical protein
MGELDCEAGGLGVTSAEGDGARLEGALSTVGMSVGDGLGVAVAAGVAVGALLGVAVAVGLAVGAAVAAGAGFGFGVAAGGAGVGDGGAGVEVGGGVAGGGGSGVGVAAAAPYAWTEQQTVVPLIGSMVEYLAVALMLSW